MRMDSVRNEKMRVILELGPLVSVTEKRQLTSWKPMVRILDTKVNENSVNQKIYEN